MRARRVAAAAVVTALVLAMTACSDPAPITDAQVAKWRELAAEKIPSATDVEIRAEQVTTMGGNSNIVFVTVHFSSFIDLNQNYAAATDLETTINDQVGHDVAELDVVYDGADDLEADIASRALDEVAGLQSVVASASVVASPEQQGHALRVTVYVYATDPVATDLPWLDHVADVTQEVASEAGGQIYSIVILPVDAIGVDVYSADIDPLVVPVSSIGAFARAGAASGCVRTSEWAYDVSNPWAIVYPVDAPGGACA